MALVVIGIICRRSVGVVASDTHMFLFVYAY